MTTHDTTPSAPRARARARDTVEAAGRTVRPADPSATAADSRRPGGRTTDPESAPPRGFLGRHGLLAYVVLAYAISWVLLVGGFLSTEAGVLDPDGGVIWWVNQVAAAGPLIAAVVVVALGRGRRGLAALGRGLVRWRVHPAWYLLVFVGVPLIMVAAVAVVFTPDVVPALTADGSLLYLQAPLGILGVAVFTGLAEEPGWRGYAQPAANRRYQPLVAALVVSVVWALWHLPNALFGPTVAETATHLLATVVNGLVLAWAYNATGGSVLIVMLLHGSQNTTSGVVRALSEGSAGAPSVSEYYLLSAAVFGVLMAGVVARTHGRLGLPHDPAAATG